MTIAADVGDHSTAALIVKQTIDKFGRIDSLILNAGVLDPVKHIESIDVLEVKNLFEINFFSVIDLVSKSIPHLRSSKGSCLFVSSGASTNAYDGWAAYGASKAALNHFASTVTLEEPSINTISIAPGVVDTQMQVDIREKFGSDMKPEALDKFLKLHESNQLLKPEVPAAIYANLALRGIPTELNGKFLRYNDSTLAGFTDA